MKGQAFEDRKQAGLLLGKYLAQKYQKQNLIVIGIPRGGVETAYYVAQALNVELSLIVSKKLPFPGHPEYGFGAVSEEDTVYVNDTSSKMLSKETIDEIIFGQEQEIKRRVASYRGGRPLPDMDDKTVILVDDGIATGVTLVPVIRLCRKKQASRIIVAAPVSSAGYDTHLNEADAIEVLIQPPGLHAISQAYLDFGEFGDEQLLGLFEKAGQEHEQFSGAQHQ